MHKGPFKIKNANCEKLLRIKVDSRLNFNENLGSIIKKTSRKINRLHERVLRIVYNDFK